MKTVLIFFVSYPTTGCHRPLFFMKPVCLILLLLLAGRVAAQDDYYKPKPVPASAKRGQTVVLRDGTEVRGEVIRQDSAETVIMTRKLGEVRLQTRQILRIEESDVPVQTYPNLFPQTMRLAPTAFQPAAGKVYFSNYAVYLSKFEYGINDNWSVGTTFLSFFPTLLFSVNTKVSLPVSNRVRLGVQAQYIGSQQSDGIFSNGNRNSIAGIGYLQGIATIGDRQNNTTFGLGWSVSNGQLSRGAVGTLGFVRKVRPQLSFISENFVLIGGISSNSVSLVGALSAGVRFDRRRHAFDLAAYLPFAVGPRFETPIFLLPFASYHLRIGQ